MTSSKTPRPQVEERKHNFLKSDEAYWCEELHRAQDYLVLLYKIDRNWTVAESQILAGSITLAHYFSNQAFVLWAMYDPSRNLIGHYFHLCMPPVISVKTVEYTDLLLDLWFDSKGQFIILDADELQQAIDAGHITPAQVQMIEETRDYIINQYSEIISGLWMPDSGLENL